MKKVLMPMFRRPPRISEHDKRMMFKLGSKKTRERFLQITEIAKTKKQVSNYIKRFGSLESFKGYSNPKNENEYVNIIIRLAFYLMNKPIMDYHEIKKQHSFYHEHNKCNRYIILSTSHDFYKIYNMVISTEKIFLNKAWMKNKHKFSCDGVPILYNKYIQTVGVITKIKKIYDSLIKEVHDEDEQIRINDLCKRMRKNDFCKRIEYLIKNPY